MGSSHTSMASKLPHAVFFALLYLNNCSARGVCFHCVPSGDRDLWLERFVEEDDFLPLREVEVSDLLFLYGHLVVSVV